MTSPGSCDIAFQTIEVCLWQAHQAHARAHRQDARRLLAALLETHGFRFDIGTDGKRETHMENIGQQKNAT